MKNISIFQSETVYNLFLLNLNFISAKEGAATDDTTQAVQDFVEDTQGQEAKKQFVQEKLQNIK